MGRRKRKRTTTTTTPTPTSTTTSTAPSTKRGKRLTATPQSAPLVPPLPASIQPGKRVRISSKKISDMDEWIGETRAKEEPLERARSEGNRQHSAALATEIRSRYSSALLDLASLPDVSVPELRLWKVVFYAPIESLRTQIAKASKAAKAAEAAGLPPGDVTALTSELRERVEDACDFYASLIFRLTRAYQLGKPVSSVDGAHNAAAVVARCYGHLGDLVRYAELSKPRADRSFARARDAYQAALEAAPGLGSAHNQLAVLATYTASPLEALFRYVCALASPSPFPSAGNNIRLLFEWTGRMLKAPPGEPESVFRLRLVSVYSALMTPQPPQSIRDIALHLWVRHKGIVFALDGDTHRKLALIAIYTLDTYASPSAFILALELLDILATVAPLGAGSWILIHACSSLWPSLTSDSVLTQALQLQPSLLTTIASVSSSLSHVLTSSKVADPLLDMEDSGFIQTLQASYGSLAPPSSSASSLFPSFISALSTASCFSDDHAGIGSSSSTSSVVGMVVEGVGVGGVGDGKEKEKEEGEDVVVEKGVAEKEKEEEEEKEVVVEVEEEGPVLAVQAGFLWPIPTPFAAARIQTGPRAILHPFHHRSPPSLPTPSPDPHPTG